MNILALDSNCGSSHVFILNYSLAESTELKEIRHPSVFLWHRGLLKCFTDIIRLLSLNLNGEKWDSILIKRLNVTHRCRGWYKRIHLNFLWGRSWVNSAITIFLMYFLFRFNEFSYAHVVSGKPDAYSLIKVKLSPDILLLECTFIILIFSLWNLCCLLSCTDSWKPEQLYSVFPKIGLVGQQTRKTGVFIRYDEKLSVEKLRRKKT